MSPPIVEELRDVLERPRLRQRMVGDPAELFEAIERLAEWTAGEPVASGVCRDPKDDKFLACAVEATSSTSSPVMPTCSRSASSAASAS